MEADEATVLVGTNDKLPERSVREEDALAMAEQNVLVTRQVVARWRAKVAPGDLHSSR